MAETFVLDEAIRALARTPAVLRAMLSDLPDGWLHANEGPETWSPFDVVGHLVHGEKSDWIPRAKHILQGPTEVPFDPYDRFAQFSESQGKSLDDLLDEFGDLRRESLVDLAKFDLGEGELDREGLHPEFGPVTLRQLLSTWVCHDYSHIAQIARVLAKHHGEAVGPWVQYLSILHR